MVHGLGSHIASSHVVLTYESRVNVLIVVVTRRIVVRMSRIHLGGYRISEPQQFGMMAFGDSGEVVHGMNQLSSCWPVGLKSIGSLGLAQCSRVFQSTT